MSGYPYARDAIQQALQEGCTGKTRALAQAYRTLRAAGRPVVHETVYAAWAGLLHTGEIVRDGRQYRVRNGGAA